MSNSMKYRGYHATIEYSSEDGMMIGSVIGIQDSLNFHGNSVEEITQAFHDSIDGYLEMCKALKRSPDKEYRGCFNVRIPQELHRQAAITAESNGMTLNQLTQKAIEGYINNSFLSQPIIMLLPETKYNARMSTNQVFSGSRYHSEASDSADMRG